MRILLGLLLALSCGAVQAGSYAWTTVNDVSLRYRVDGSGDHLIVLLSESGVPIEVWDDFLPRLMAPDRKILRYDPRGVGLSEKFRNPITMQDHVDDLAALLDAVAPDAKVVLIAGAIGGSIGMQFAAQFPERVAGLAVTSPSAVTQTRDPRPRINPAVDPEGANAAADRTLSVTYPEQFRTDAAHFERLRAMEGVNDFDSEVLTEALINTTDFTDVLPKIQCPTLIMATSVFPRPVSSVEALAAKIPNARFEVIESGHLASYQTPDLVAGHVDPFLDELSW